MKYRTQWRPNAVAQLRAIDQKTAMRILHKLAELEHDPRGLNTKELVGSPGLRRLRVGDYRVVYTIDDGELVVLVVAVGHRSTIYREVG